MANRPNFGGYTPIQLTSNKDIAQLLFHQTPPSDNDNNNENDNLKPIIDNNNNTNNGNSNNNSKSRVSNDELCGICGEVHYPNYTSPYNTLICKGCFRCGHQDHTSEDCRNKNIVCR